MGNMVKKPCFQGFFGVLVMNKVMHRGGIVDSLWIKYIVSINGRVLKENQANRMNEDQNYIYTALLLAAFVIGIFAFANHVSMKQQRAYQEYEKCVEREYSTTPAEWRKNHGELPPCETLS